jgi:hypothetical protein
VHQFADIKPAPDGDGFCLHVGHLPPTWFAQEAQAIAYAQELFPKATIRIFAGGGIIDRTIPPRE